MLSRNNYQEKIRKMENKKILLDFSGSIFL
jgi:hypothetical protein